MYTRILCVILFQWISILAFPQTETLNFTHLTTHNGLSQDNAWQTLQDKLGFIWVATEDGLNLYDGYSFKVFKHSAGDSTSISNSNIHWISESRDGNIWIGTQAGLNRYDREHNTFESYNNDPEDDGSISNGDVNFVFQDSKNNLWAGTTNGLNLFDPATKKFKRFPPYRQ